VILLTDFATTGDGLIAALQVLALLVEEKRPASEVCRRFTPLPQLLENIRYTGPSPLNDAEVMGAIAAAGTRLGARGRVLVRPSGTEPLIRVMAEAEDAAEMRAVVAELAGLIRARAAASAVKKTVAAE
jgi:phosphoglucosamine mutase